MILGRDTHVHSACFDELHTAVLALEFHNPNRRTVVFNAHAFPDHIPAGAVVYNLENVGVQVDPQAFSGHHVWEFTQRNMKAWKRDNVQHVPVGYHHTMERFKRLPWHECKWDIVFTGSPCARRHFVLDELARKGLTMLQVPHQLYGEGRDKILAQSRLALNIQYYENGVHPILRTAHAVANRLPILSEQAPEMPDWALLRAG